MPLCYLQVTEKLTALKGLDAQEIQSYLEFVIEGKPSLNHEILCLGYLSAAVIGTMNRPGG